MTYSRFEELPVWNAAIELSKNTFELCNDKSFNFQGDLRSQLGKAALSVSNNIAEGFDRQTRRELIRYLHIARGSNGEVRSMLHVIARMDRYQHLHAERERLMELVTSIGRQLNGWIACLRELPPESETEFPV